MNAMEQIERLPRSAAVLLARLMATPVPKPAALRKDVSGVVGNVSDEAWARAVSAATGSGWVAAAPAKVREPKANAPVVLRLTAEGRTAARDRLGALGDHPKLTPIKVAGFWQWADPKPSAASVLLTRLFVPSEKPPTHAAARKAVVGVIGPVDDEGWAKAVASLVSAGYIDADAAPLPAVAAPSTSGAIALNDAGRSGVAEWLGLPVGETALKWPAIRDKWLPAATVPVEDRVVFNDDKRVIPLLLGRQFGVGPVASVDQAIQAVVCKDLGHPEARDLNTLVASVLSSRLGKTLPPLPLKEMDKQVPAAVFDLPAASPKAVRAAALKQWAAMSRPARADDLPSFAAAVNRTAAASPTGWFGDDKVFISHVHRQLADGTSLDAFKQRLVEANTAGLVQLARADLVAAMDPADVRASEVKYLTAEFHFIRVEKGRPS